MLTFEPGLSCRQWRAGEGCTTAPVVRGLRWPSVGWTWLRMKEDVKRKWDTAGVTGKAADAAVCGGS